MWPRTDQHHPQTAQFSVLAEMLLNTRDILVSYRPRAGPPACLSGAGSHFTGLSGGSWQLSDLSEAKQWVLARSHSQTLTPGAGLVFLSLSVQLNCSFAMQPWLTCSYYSSLLFSKGESGAISPSPSTAAGVGKPGNSRLSERRECHLVATRSGTRA